MEQKGKKGKTLEESQCAKLLMPLALAQQESLTLIRRLMVQQKKSTDVRSTTVNEISCANTLSTLLLAGQSDALV